MNDFNTLIIEPLDAHHDRAAFRCNVESLDLYLKKQAQQDIKRRISRVFVATRPENPEGILGYYTLSSLSIALSQLPENIFRRLPRHPIPAALVGRLAVAKTEQGHGIGKKLLVDAIKRALSVGDQIAIYATVVDAVDEKAVGFYKRYGLIPFPEGTPRLFLPLKSV